MIIFFLSQPVVPTSHVSSATSQVGRWDVADGNTALVPVLFCRRPCGSLPKREPAMSIQLLGPRDGRRVRSLLEKEAHAPVRSQSTVLNPAGVVILRELDLIGGRDFQKSIFPGPLSRASKQVSPDLLYWAFLSSRVAYCSCSGFWM